VALPGFAEEDLTDIVTWTNLPILSSSPLDGSQVREELSGIDNHGRPVWSWGIALHRIWPRLVFRQETIASYQSLQPFFRNRRCAYLPDTDTLTTSFIIKFNHIRVPLEVWHGLVDFEIGFEEI